MSQEGYGSTTDRLDGARWNILIGSQIFHGFKYLSQLVAITIEKNFPNYFNELSVDAPTTFVMWRGFNHHASSVALGISGVAGFKWAFDRRGEGGIGSDLLAVLCTTGLYTFFEGMSVRSGATFSVEDVALTFVTATTTVLLDRMLRKRMEESQ